MTISYFNLPIKALHLEGNYSIDFKQLKESFFDCVAKITEDQIHIDNVKILPPKNIHLQSQWPLFLWKQEKNSSIIAFASKLNLQELSTRINSIPEQFVELTLQMNTFFSALEDAMKKIYENERLQEHLFKEYISEIKENNGVQIVADPILFCNASLEDCKDAIVVPEHAFAVSAISSGRPMGTTGIGSCIGLFAMNRHTHRIAFAHLDDATMVTYQKSFEKMFLQVGGTKEHPTEVFLIGGTKSELQNKMRGIDLRISQTLALSLKKYIANRNDMVLKAAHLFDHDISDILVKVSDENVSFLKACGMSSLLCKKSVMHSWNIAKYYRT